MKYLYVAAAIIAGAYASKALAAPSVSEKEERGLAFDFGESSQNVDQSVNYNLMGDNTSLAEIFGNNPKALYIGLAVLGVFAFVFVARKK